MLRPSPRPTFALSSLCSPVISTSRLREIAHRCGLDGVDLHGRRAKAWTRAADRDPVAALWISARRELDSARLDQLAQRFARIDPGSRCCIALSSPTTCSSERAALDLVRAASRLQERIGRGHRVALAVPASTRGGGREHLDRLRWLRVVAAEWDIGIALDVAGASDWQWEAEAAVFHAAPSLALVRVTLPTPCFDAHVRTRLTDRTIRACADAGFNGVFSVAPPLLPWRWTNRAVLAAKTETAVLAIRTALRAPLDEFSFDEPRAQPSPWSDRVE